MLTVGSLKASLEGRRSEKVGREEEDLYQPHGGECIFWDSSPATVFRLGSKDTVFVCFSFLNKVLQQGKQQSMLPVHVLMPYI